MTRLVSFIILAFGAILSLCQEGPIVSTPTGRILGVILKSRKGVDIYSFRGIKYAEPPVKDLRFKPPVPVKPWNGVYNATANGPVCFQPFLPFLSEDCLHLNVYTRRINSGEESRPVFAFIHGGSYMEHTSRSEWYGPEYLLDHDIVFVVMNYRLGTLGTFSTGDSYAPGNYGMKDQVEALRWIQKNIRAFGGDASRVTIIGDSAGGASVGLHLSSPMSRGLFHRAVLISGSSANTWAVDRNPIKIAKKQAALLDCPTDTSQNMVECMKQKPAQEITDTYHRLKGWYDSPQIVVHPTIESQDNGIERFLIKDPIQSLQEGDIADVPIMIGSTKDEFSYKALPKLQDKIAAADMSANWTRVAPIAFIYEPNDTISNRLREFYLGSVDQPITIDSFYELGKLYADSIITFGVVRGAKLIAEKSKKPVYLYQFNYQGKYTNAHYAGPFKNLPQGVYHGDDLIYIFYSSILKRPILSLTSEEGLMVDKWTTVLKNFLETGNPTPEPMELLNNVIWTPYKNDDPKYLDVDKTLQVRSGMYYEDRMSLWENLFPLSSSSPSLHGLGFSLFSLLRFQFFIVIYLTTSF